MQWGKDRPPTGQFDAYSPQQPQTPGYPQNSPSYGFSQYGGPAPMTPQGGHSSTAMNSMPGYPPAHHSPGPSPASRGWTQQPQGNFPPSGMPPQGYGNMQMPGSAGGYGHDQNPAAGWGQQPTSGYPRNPPTNNSFGGY